MLSFNNIGNLGRVANQMFQYASLKGISKRNNYEFCIPPKEIFGVFDRNVKVDKFCVYDFFDLESINKIECSSNKVFREKSFCFDEELYDNCEDNIDLLGYFQSEKYFKDIEEEIRSDFTFKDDVIKECKLFYDENFESTEVISLHVRRGDYLSNANHPIQSLEYYEKSLKEFDSEIPVLIFSDDPEWCEKQDLFSGDRFFISNGDDPRTDLCLMSMCDYHIIANSSFSWWGSWLAKSKKTVAPKIWFDGDCKKHDTKDLYLNDWIIL